MISYCVYCMTLPAADYNDVVGGGNIAKCQTNSAQVQDIERGKQHHNWSDILLKPCELE